MKDDEQALVVKAQGGDRAAFEELVRRTSRFLFARLYLDTEDAHRSEDLLQETFLKAFQSIAQLREPGHLRRWLLSIAEKTVIDSARRDARQSRVRSEVSLQIPAAFPSPEAELGRSEEHGRVLAALRSLPEEYRMPLTLRYLAGDDYESIAMQLGLTNGSLRGLLHRGLKVLRVRLTEKRGEG